MKQREKRFTNTYYIQYRYIRIVTNIVKSLSEINIDLLQKESSNVPFVHKHRIHKKKMNSLCMYKIEFKIKINESYEFMIQ